MDSLSNNNNLAKNKKDDSFLFSTSLIFNQNIDELWLYLRDLEAEVSNLDIIDDFKYIKGINTWTVGNIFSFYWVGVSHLRIKCKDIKVETMKKQIKWKFECDIGLNYYKTLNLYRITQSEQTLVKVIFSRTKKKNNLIDFSQTINYYSNLHFEILNHHAKYLQSIQDNVILYQSCIINENYKLIWKLINIKELSEIISNFVTNIEFKGAINEIGSFMKYYDKHLKRNIFLKVTDYDNFNNKKCWLFRLEAIGSNVNNIVNIIEFKLIKINDFKTHTSLLYKFRKNSNSYYIKNFDINSKTIFKNIIRLIENMKNDSLINKEQSEINKNNEQKIKE